MNSLGLDMSYKLVSTAMAGLCLILSIALTFFPNLIYWLFELVPNGLGDFLAKRAAVLFLGLSILSYLSRNAPPSELRSAIALAFFVTMGGLALVGLYEYLRGYAGPGIWLAMSTETAFGYAFWRLWSARD